MTITVLIPDGDVRKLFITPEVTRVLEGMGTLKWNDGDYEPRQMARMLEDCDVCITGWGCPTLDEAILVSAKSLRLVVHTGGTVSNLVSDFMYDRGIRIVSANEIFAESVAEATIAYMFTALRRIPYYNSVVQDGKWKTMFSLNSGLLGKKVGLVGFGAIARHLVPMLRPFRVSVEVYDPFVDDATFTEYGVTRVNSLEALFSGNDIISVHAAQVPETYRIINRDMLSRLKDGGLIVNTARGSIIDEDVLAEELASGRISAILDVFDEEPLPADSKLRGMDNALLLPHMAGPTTDQYAKVCIGLAEEIRRFISGQPLKYEISREYASKMTK